MEEEEEEEEMGSKYFKSLYNQLSSIEEDAPWANQVMGQLQMQKTDVRFLKVFCLCFESLDSTTDEESRETLRSIIITPLNVIWAEEESPFASELEGKIPQTILQIDRSEKLVLVCSWMQFNSSTSDEMLRFLGDLLKNLNDLLNYRADKIVPFKKQIDTLKDKLVFLCKSLKKIATCLGSSQEFVSFLKISAPRFLDFLIQNKTIELEEESVQKEPKELDDSWLLVTNVGHLTEHVINSCISLCFVSDQPIWYHMSYLCDVFDRIKVVKTKVEKMNERNIYNARYLPHGAGFVSTLLGRGWNYEINKTVVGIIGMGGLGKTV